ncbi:ATP-binding protein [Cryptosporangium aurantiacum]|uniref:Circadian input-output histidine kinase CikA n=1 Tax=Cryptosporangium aurantiacum TaxID=134849 RepID=A0A1M7IHL5_9ACTN|nr:ATP-binding protein [Cryptosporangium aurantiacum]SHM40231.1 Signal transduction histidine kinase [Cryptosporangium aurantiacum]
MSNEPADLTALTAEVEALRAELEETNRGLMALYAELSAQTDELDRARVVAEEATRAKAAFLADMGHEIRNPLNSVIGFAELLDETELTHEQSDYLKPIRAAGDHLRSLMDDLLDFSKLEAGYFTFESVPFDLVGCVEDALAIVAPQAAAKHLGLAAVFTHDTPATAHGDPTRLRQILVNLLVNAVKFTAEGQVWVELTTRRAGSTPACLSFAVHDTGIGIAPDALERIFVPFAQADASTHRRYGGTGLGLSIARELSHRMDGELTVASEVGVGSTFTSTVRMAVGPETLTDPDDRPLCGRTVLLVHDDPVTERALRTHLTSWGAVVRTEPGPVDPALAVVDAGAERFLGLGHSVPVLVVVPLALRRQTPDGVAAVLHSPVRRSQLRLAVDAVLSAITA